VKSFDTRVYNISDFLEWQRNNTLNISPDFQRRGVWTRVAKSYLIDTILRGRPIPKLLITQSLQDKKNVRTVVDGQQRVRTFFEFISGSFTVLAAHNEQYAKKKFEELPEALQSEILKYEIGVDVLFDVEYKDLLDIFARINTYSVVLNPQEKLNAKFQGAFKTYAYELGHDYVQYFTDADVLTKKQVSRMGEAQLASDLLVILCDGVQTVKNIEKFYRKYETAEDVPADLEAARGNFRVVMKSIASIYGSDELPSTNWARPHLFYTLFSVVAHALIGVKRLAENSRPLLDQNRPVFSKKSAPHWRAILDEISAQYDVYTQPGIEDVPPDYASFIDYARRRTTDTESRVERAKFLIRRLV
jgi:hypothetical protein